MTALATVTEEYMVRVVRPYIGHLVQEPWFWNLLASPLFWIGFIALMALGTFAIVKEERDKADKIVAARIKPSMEASGKAEADRLLKFFVEHPGGKREGPMTWTQANDLAHATDGQVIKPGEITVSAVISGTL